MIHVFHRQRAARDVDREAFGDRFAASIHTPTLSAGEHAMSGTTARPLGG
jgi:hypothetical protein